MTNTSNPFKKFVNKKDKEPTKEGFCTEDKYDGNVGPQSSSGHVPAAINMSNSSTNTQTLVLDDGTKIVKYPEPQKLQTLVQDAKKELGGEQAKFFSNGWVIGQKGLARISPDGSSITYYPDEVAHLVKELLEH